MCWSYAITALRYRAKWILNANALVFLTMTQIFRQQNRCPQGLYRRDDPRFSVGHLESLVTTQRFEQQLPIRDNHHPSQ